MTYTSKMAEAWAAFRISAVTKADSLFKLEELYDESLRDLDRLLEFGLVDNDEYHDALYRLNMAANTLVKEMVLETANA